LDQQWIFKSALHQIIALVNAVTILLIGTSLVKLVAKQLMISKQLPTCLSNASTFPLETTSHRLQNDRTDHRDYANIVENCKAIKITAGMKTKDVNLGQCKFEQFFLQLFFKHFPFFLDFIQQSKEAVRLFPNNQRLTI